MKINFDIVNSGFRGALKMTILEEQIHSLQENLIEINKKALRNKIARHEVSMIKKGTDVSSIID